MSDSEHSIVSYTSISLDSDPSALGIPLMDASEVLEMDPYEEVAQQGQATPPSPAYVPDPMELEHHVPVYVPDPVYLEYLVPSDDDIPVEDLEEEPEEDPKEDPIDYTANADDNEDEEEESSEDDDDEEEDHLAPADSTAIASLAVDLALSIEETEPFETDESVATPPPPPTYRTTSRISVRSQAPIPFPSKAEAARLFALPTAPQSLLTPLSSPLPRFPHHHYLAAEIRLRAASPLPSPTPLPTHHPLPLPAPSTSRRADILEVDIPPQKKLLLTAPTPRFKDAQRDRAALRDEVYTLRRYLSSLCTTHKQERVEARQALDRFEAYNRALKA
ncbi:hypothetical protein Tco_0281850 [Tanacetum coccineum]